MDDHRLRTSSMKNAILLAIVPATAFATTSPAMSFTSTSQIVGAKGASTMAAANLPTLSGTPAPGADVTWGLPTIPETLSTFALSDVNARKYLETLKYILTETQLTTVKAAMKYEYTVTKVNDIPTNGAAVPVSGVSTCIGSDDGCFYDSIQMPSTTLAGLDLYTNTYKADLAKQIKCTLPNPSNAQLNNDNTYNFNTLATFLGGVAPSELEFTATSGTVCGWTLEVPLTYEVEVQFKSGSEVLGPSFSMKVTAGHTFEFTGFGINSDVDAGVTNIVYTSNPLHQVPLVINELTVYDADDNSADVASGAILSFTKSSTINCAGTLGFANPSVELCSYDAACALVFKASCAATDYVYHATQTDKFTLSYDLSTPNDITACTTPLAPSAAETDTCAMKLKEWKSAVSCVADAANPAMGGACLHMGSGSDSISSNVHTSGDTKAAAVAKFVGGGGEISSGDKATHLDTLYFYVRFPEGSANSTNAVSMRIPYKVLHEYTDLNVHSVGSG